MIDPDPVGLDQCRPRCGDGFGDARSGPGKLGVEQADLVDRLVGEFETLALRGVDRLDRGED